MTYTAIKIGAFREIDGQLVRPITIDQCPHCPESTTGYGTVDGRFFCDLCHAEIGNPRRVIVDEWARLDNHQMECERCQTGTLSCPDRMTYMRRIDDLARGFFTSYVVVIPAEAVKSSFPLTLCAWNRRGLFNTIAQFPNAIIVDQREWVTVLVNVF